MHRALPLVQRHPSLLAATGPDEPDTPSGASLRRRISQHGRHKPPQRVRLVALVLTTFLACVCLISLSHRPPLPNGEGMVFTSGIHAGVGVSKLSRRSSHRREVSPLYLGQGHGHAARDETSLERPPDTERIPIAAASLLLASHNRVMWHDLESGTNHVIHEGEGVYHGVFPGTEVDEKGQPTSLWLLSRPHNWHPSSAQEVLLHVDAYTGAELARVRVMSRFAHDAVRKGDTVYLSSTGDGQVVRLALPDLKETGRFDLFTPHQHLNSLAPLRKDRLWGLLHNLGNSDLVLLDTEEGKVVETYRGVGRKAHNLLAWHSWLLLLDSANGALVRFQPETRKREELWRAPEEGMFAKGLAVVDDIAYFGLSAAEPRDARTDPTLDCQLAAFDLLNVRLLWRRQVPSHGLLNVVAAPHLSEASTYAALQTLHAISNTSREGWHAQEGLASADEVDPRVLSHMGFDRRRLSELDVRFPAKIGGRWASGLPYLDGAAKQKQVLAAGLYLPLTRLPQGVLDNVKAVLKQEGDRIWDSAAAESENAVLDGRDAQQASIKGQTQALLLLFSDKAGKHVYQFPWWPAKFRDALTPILEAVVGRADMGKIMRLQLTRVPAGAEIKIHMDVGGYAKSGHRIHVPLQVNPKTQFEVCPENPTTVKHRHSRRTVGTTQGRGSAMGEPCVTIPLAEGFAFELNNHVLHRVSNKGTEPRIHLLIDIAESNRGPVTPLLPGQHCSYTPAGSIQC